MGKVCQDALGWGKYRDTVLVAVADGHGSPACKYSDIGARKGVSSFFDVMLNLAKQFQNNQEEFHAFVSRNRNDVIPQKICGEWQKKTREFHQKSHREEEFSTIYYGTTLLGMMICPSFYFSFQIGDGDILSVTLQGETVHVIRDEKILGTETHSLSSTDAWKNALTAICYVSNPSDCPALFMLSTDGFCNSFVSEKDFLSSGKDYMNLLREYGEGVIKKHLRGWLKETTESGCGDDIALILVANKLLL
jgi:serine/threonine protein phosphatase PrpC